MNTQDPNLRQPEAPRACPAYETHSRREFLRLSFSSVMLLTIGSQLSRKPGDLTSLSLQQASKLVRNKSVSPVDLTRACLERIQRLNPKLNAFITVAAEQALAQARELEIEVQHGRWRGPLHGIPLALKDNIDTSGIKTTAASAVFAERIPAEDAEVVRRLKAAGAIIIGKLNLDEFAIGLTSTLSHFGPVHNPWKLDHIAGGSSGGSAAAVSAHLCYGALGSDTGGSIRIPAAYCGVVALKPTYGLVSTRGLVPLSWSLDHVGPMCRSVAETALLLSAIAGYDPQESGSVNAPIINYAAALGTKTSALRVGISREMFSEIADPEIKAAVNEAVSVLRSMTASVRDIELPSIPEGTWVKVALAEAYVFHAPLLARAAERYNPIIRKRAELGSTISAKDYIEARRDVERLRRVIGDAFSGVDLIVAPTAYVPPVTIEQSLREEQSARPPLTPAPAFNIYGLPTVSVPCGFISSGLPIGLQISGPRLGEAKVLALAYAYEQATDWHRRRPVL
jgi:aspartyl-tRNA(Asn)/glutamyl-tRNA(Gln) amidotransferase subunit A